MGEAAGRILGVCSRDVAKLPCLFVSGSAAGPTTTTTQSICWAQRGTLRCDPAVRLDHCEQCITAVPVQYGYSCMTITVPVPTMR
eukprot:COSAG01_NODE_3030_length_6698_cov_13.145022_2_plen_85_part_00